MYRYGDGTPLPVQDNFIETLLAAVDACVGAFGAAAELEERRDRAKAVRKEADDELRRFAVMDKAVEAALSPMKPSHDKGASPSAMAAAKALAAARHAIGQSRAAIEQRLQQLASEPRPERAIERTRLAMAAFFERHALPETSWRWSWRAEETSATAEASATSGRFRATFDLDLPRKWSGVVRVGTLLPGLEAVLARRGMFGVKQRRASLERAGLVAVERGPDRQVLTLREQASKPSMGWRITLRDPDQSGTTVVAVDLAGRAMGNELALDPEQAQPFLRLWDVVDAAMIELRNERRRLRELKVGDATIETAEPAVLGRAILGVLGPIVRQIRARSRVPGELAIKRDMGDGRREEIYVPRADLERRFATLPTALRRPFEDIGLGRQTTGELAGDDQQTLVDAQPAAVRPSPPPPPGAPPERPTLKLSEAALDAALEQLGEKADKEKAEKVEKVEKVEKAGDRAQPPPLPPARVEGDMLARLPRVPATLPGEKSVRPPIPVKIVDAGDDSSGAHAA